MIMFKNFELQYLSYAATWKPLGSFTFRWSAKRALLRNLFRHPTRMLRIVDVHEDRVCTWVQIGFGLYNAPLEVLVGVELDEYSKKRLEEARAEKDRDLDDFKIELDLADLHNLRDEVLELITETGNAGADLLQKIGHELRERNDEEIRVRRTGGALLQAFVDGRTAFREGKSIDDCPFATEGLPKAAQRVADLSQMIGMWRKGWRYAEYFEDAQKLYRLERESGQSVGVVDDAKIEGLDVSGGDSP